MSLPQTVKLAFIAALALLTIGIGSLALSIEQPLSAQQWAQWQSGSEAPRASFTGINDPASRAWDYETYLAAKSEANLTKGACGFGSMNGDICALNGFAAPINWLGLAFLVIGVGSFYRQRTTVGGNGIYA